MSVFLSCPDTRRTERSGEFGLRQCWFLSPVTIRASSDAWPDSGRDSGRRLAATTPTRRGDDGGPLSMASDSSVMPWEIGPRSTLRRIRADDTTHEVCACVARTLLRARTACGAGNRLSAICLWHAAGLAETIGRPAADFGATKRFPVTVRVTPLANVRVHSSVPAVSTIRCARVVRTPSPKLQAGTAVIDCEAT